MRHKVVEAGPCHEIFSAFLGAASACVMNINDCNGDSCHSRANAAGLSGPPHPALIIPTYSTLPHLHRLGFGDCRSRLHADGLLLYR